MCKFVKESPLLGTVSLAKNTPIQQRSKHILTIKEHNLFFKGKIGYKTIFAAGIIKRLFIYLMVQGHRRVSSSAENMKLKHANV